MIVVVERDVDLAAFGRIAERIVEQVREQNCEARRIAAHARRRLARETEIDVPLRRERAAGDDRILRNRNEIAIDGARCERFGLDARERQ